MRETVMTFHHQGVPTVMTVSRREQGQPTGYCDF